MRNETENQAARDIALRSVTQIEAAYGRSANETAALARWLIGALAIMNGGGLLIAVLIRAEIDPVAARMAVAIFGLGLVVAFLAACLSAAMALWLSASLRQASAAWMGAATGDGIGDDTLVAVRRVRGRARLSRLLVGLIGFVSAGLLFAGGAVLWREFVAPVFAARTAQDQADAEAIDAAEPGEMAANGVTLVAENVAETAPAPTPAPVPVVAQSKPVQKAAPRPVQKATPAPASRATASRTSASTRPAPAAVATPSPAPVREPPRPVPQLPYAPPPASDAPVASSSTAGSPPSQ